jgi:pyruvate dehydrogenase E1 component alpha subunit
VCYGLSIKLGTEDLIKIYGLMVATRRFEDKVNELYQEGRFSETPHSCKGQEAVGVGATFGLRKTDYIMPSLRTRSAFIAKGVSMKDILADMYGKIGGPSNGKHTSHHLGYPELRVLAGTGVDGSSKPLGVGAALAEWVRGTDNVSVVFFGDGASNRGDFHEGANMAAALGLPCVFVCENNLYALSTHQNRHMKVKDISTRAMGYGMPGVSVDGQDVLAVYAAVQDAVGRARSGGGPSLVECKTYRFRGHSEHHDPDDGRPKDELAEWRKRCPIDLFEKRLAEMGVLNEEIKTRITEEIDEEIRGAVEYAESLPFSPEADLTKNVMAL